MFQNHLMQIIAHIGMEPPIAADAAVFLFLSFAKASLPLLFAVDGVFFLSKSLDISLMLLLN